MYNKNCNNACTDLKMREKRGLEIKYKKPSQQTRSMNSYAQD
jgi:hypothetical protein